MNYTQAQIDRATTDSMKEFIRPLGKTLSLSGR